MGVAQALEQTCANRTTFGSAAKGGDWIGFQLRVKFPSQSFTEAPVRKKPGI